MKARLKHDFLRTKVYYILFFRMLEATAVHGQKQRPHKFVFNLSITLGHRTMQRIYKGELEVLIELESTAQTHSKHANKLTSVFKTLTLHQTSSHPPTLLHTQKRKRKKKMKVKMCKPSESHRGGGHGHNMLLIHSFLKSLSSLWDFFLVNPVQNIVSLKIRQMYSELYSLQCMPSLFPIKGQRDNEYNVLMPH